MMQTIEIHPQVGHNKDLLVLHAQYHDCWWPGDTRSQVISSNGIDLVILEYSHPSTTGVNGLHMSLKLFKYS